MAVFNFKATEDSTPGGGVIKLGTGTSFTLRQSDYPDYNLANMTSNNFFKNTVCKSSSSVGQKNHDAYTNVRAIYSGGSATIDYKFSNGVGTVTVQETDRSCYYEEYLGSPYYYQKIDASAGYTHTVYMSRNPIM